MPSLPPKHHYIGHRLVVATQQAEAQRITATRYDWAWRKLLLSYRKANPVRAHCLQADIVRLGDVCEHIKQVAYQPELRREPSYLMHLGKDWHHR